MLVLKEGKQLTDLVFESKKIGVTVSQKAGFDALCAGFALYKSLKASNKEVRFIYPYEVPQQLKEYIKDADLTPVQGSRGLMINIDFSGTNIEKLKYSVDGDICSLVLLPAPKEFGLDKVTYSPYGFDFDLLIVLGAEKLADLDVIQKEYGDVLATTNIINIDKSTKNENFGILNVVEPDVESLSHMVFHKLSTWHYKVDKDTAKVLLLGISSSNGK